MNKANRKALLIRQRQHNRRQRILASRNKPLGSIAYKADSAGLVVKTPLNMHRSAWLRGTPDFMQRALHKKLYRQLSRARGTA